MHMYMHPVGKGRESLCILYMHPSPRGLKEQLYTETRGVYCTVENMGVSA